MITMIMMMMKMMIRAVFKRERVWVRNFQKKKKNSCTFFLS